MTIDARQIFKTLRGTWRLSRQIPEHGTMTGTATFSPLLDDPSLFYREEGIAHLMGTSHHFFKEYIYRYENSCITIYFHENPKRTYHSLRFDHGVYKAEHQCNLDHYHSRYDFRDIEKGKWSIECQVKGPKKDYTIHTQFERIDPKT